MQADASPRCTCYDDTNIGADRRVDTNEDRESDLLEAEIVCDLSDLLLGQYGNHGIQVQFFRNLHVKKSSGDYLIDNDAYNTDRIGDFTYLPEGRRRENRVCL